MSWRRRAAISSTTLGRAERAGRAGLAGRDGRVRAAIVMAWRPLGQGAASASCVRRAAPEQFDPSPGVDRQRRPLDTLFHPAPRPADQRRAGIEQDDIAPDAGLAAKDRLAHPGVLIGQAALEARGRGPLEPERGGIDDMPLDRVSGDDVRHAAAVERQLVDAVAVDDEGALRPEPADHLGEPCAPRRHRRHRPACRRVPAGLVNGPSRLNAVRTPISRRVGPACFIAGWKPART